MDHIDFGFEPPDLAAYLWPVIGALLALEVVRWIARAGRWRRVRRALIAIVAAALAVPFLWRFVPRASHQTQPLAVLLLAGLALLWLVRSYAVRSRLLDWRLRAVFLAVRGLVLVLVVLVVLRPVVRLHEVHEDRGTLLVLRDDSRSMTIRDAALAADAPLVTRSEQVDHFLDVHRATLDRIARTRTVSSALFDTTVHEHKAQEPRGRGRYTALASCIDAAYQQAIEDGQRVTGVIVLTDGGENFSTITPDAVAQRLAQAGVPLWAIGFGSEWPVGQTRDLSPRQLDAPPRVSVLDRLNVGATFTALGLAGEPITITLRIDDEPVDVTTVTPGRSEDVAMAAFSYTPSRPGTIRVTVEASCAALPPERRTARLSQFVQVTKDFVSVLYIDRPRYERAAIARALETADRIQLTKTQIAKSGSRITNALPRDEKAWQAYDVVMLGDVPFDALYRAQRRAIRTRVLDEGAGLAVIAGRRGLEDAANAVPEFQGLLPTVGAGARIDGPVALSVTPAGAASSILQTVSGDDGGAAWTALPPTPSYAALGDLAPAAQALLTTSGGAPILVVQEVGTGRSAVAAIDSTWQWAMASEQAAEVQRRFWRQLVLWLANRRPTVWVTTNQPRYALPRLQQGAESIVIEAGVTAASSADPDAPVRLTGVLIGPDPASRRRLSFTRSKDVFKATPTITQEGDYRVAVEATVGEQKTNPAEAAFVVATPDTEMDVAVANFALLREMTQPTAPFGGGFAPADQADALLERILARPDTVRRTTTETIDLTDRARLPLLVVILSLLVLEWLLRKIRGLP